MIKKQMEGCKTKYFQEGQTTDQIDELVHVLTLSNGAYPSPLHYRNFPKSVCTSVNNVACHGIPDDRPLCNGDIINVDITVGKSKLTQTGEENRKKRNFPFKVYLNGFHGDCSKTFLVGDVDKSGRDLVGATEFVLEETIKRVRPGQRINEIGRFIEQVSRSLKYNVIPCFIGHGIGRFFHGPPDIYHVDNPYPGILKPGMTFTIEPILTPGEPEIEILEDDWTAVTVDNAWTAQAEHTVLITDSGCEILTVC